MSLYYLVFVGAAAQTVGYFAYIKGTLKGTTKPNRVTWIMWSVAPLVATVASVSAGAGWAALPVFMAGFGPLLVLAASLANKNSYWKLGTFDYLCGFFSILALVLWAVTFEPAVAIVFSIVSDAFAAVPTLAKAWQHPETESGLVYTTGLFNALTGFTAIKIWRFTAYAFPIYLVAINSALIFTIYHRRLRS